MRKRRPGAVSEAINTANFPSSPRTPLPLSFSTSAVPVPRDYGANSTFGLSEQASVASTAAGYPGRNEGAFGVDQQQSAQNAQVTIGGGVVFHGFIC